MLYMALIPRIASIYGVPDVPVKNILATAVVLCGSFACTDMKMIPVLTRLFLYFSLYVLVGPDTCRCPKIGTSISRLFCKIYPLRLAG